METLKQQIERLCAKHGDEVVLHAFMDVIKTHLDLEQTAEEIGLLPHIVGKDVTAGRRN